MKNIENIFDVLPLVACTLGVLGGCAESPSEVGDDRAPLAQQSAEAQGAALPASFGLTGCGLPAVCQSKQLSTGWEAICGAQKIGGADAASLSTFTLADGRVCSGSVSGGALKGSCSGGDAGASCSFQSVSELLPTPYCAELPKKLTKLDACGAPPAGAQNIVAEECEIVQNECRYQASCSGGLVFSGNVTPAGLIWDMPSNYRCNGAIADGKLTGTCTQRGVAADAGTPGTCAIKADAPEAPATCSDELPKGGFVLNGCGHEGTVCTVAQRGCIWQATCGKDVYRARVTKPGVYEFNLASGAKCSASVKDGVFSGSCGEGADVCAFTSGAPAPVVGCLSLPTKGLKTNGCGPELSCEVLQSGCAWQAACSNANSTFVYKGTATAGGVTFEGQNSFQCWADKEAGSERLVGGCSRDGTRESQCAERLNEGGLVLSPR